MKDIEDYLSALNSKLPELLTPKDLVDIGLYKSLQACSVARNKKEGPEFFRISHKGVLYPKKSILEFLRKHMQEKAI